MSLVDELSRLEELKNRGALNDDEFQRAKARLIDGVALPGPAAGPAAVNKLRRSRTDKWIGGVCGGLGVLTGVDAWIWRLLITLLFLFGGTGLLIYLLLWIFVPQE